MSINFVNILLLLVCLVGISLGFLEELFGSFGVDLSSYYYYYYDDTNNPCDCSDFPSGFDAACTEEEEPVRCVDGLQYPNCCKGCTEGEKENPKCFKVIEACNCSTAPSPWEFSAECSVYEPVRCSDGSNQGNCCWGCAGAFGRQDYECDKVME